MSSGRCGAGILVVDKRSGLSSFAVVQEVRRRLGASKAGHAGTLDPMATGVLPVCLGEATKIAGLLLVGDKAYWGRAELGVETDTLDRSGRVVARREIGAMERGHVEQLLAAMVGPQLQVPPAFSAVHCDGERAYARARRGEAVELAPRRVEIRRLELQRWDPPFFELHLECSKGTYVRSLVAEIGQRLGCGATLVALRRLRSGPFELSQAVALEELEQEASRRLVSMDQALGHLPLAEVTTTEAGRLQHGQPLPWSGAAEPGLLRVRVGAALVALGEVRGGQLWPKRVFTAVDIPACIAQDGVN